MATRQEGDARSSHGSDDFEEYKQSPELHADPPAPPAPAPTPAPKPEPKPDDYVPPSINVPRNGSVSSIILKADGSNYLAWSYILPSVLGTTAFCWEVVNGDLTYPSAADRLTPAGAIRARNWEIGNRAGRFILINSIQPSLVMSQFPHNAASVEAAEIWRQLKGKFTSTNGGLKEMIMTRFMNYKFSQGQSSGENLLAFDQIINQGTLLGVTYSDDLKVVRLLDSLPQSWETFRQGWSARVSESRTLAHLKEAIQLESLRRGKEVTELNALFTRFNINSGSQRRRAVRRTTRRTTTRTTEVTCYNCGRRGHIRSECRQPSQQANPNGPQPASSGTSGTGPNQNSAGRYNLRPRPNRGGNNNRGRRQQRGRPQPQANIVEALIVETSTPEANLANDINEFIVDSGTTHHMVNNKGWITDYQPFTEHRQVKLGGARTLNAQGSGTAYVPVQQSGERIILKLCDVLFVPRLRRNLVSVSKLTDDGYQIKVTTSSIDLISGEKVIQATRENALYVFKGVSVIEGNVAASKSSEVSLKEVHEAFAHIGIQALKKMLVREGFIVKDDFNQCEACVRGKMHRSTYRSKPIGARANRPGYIHLDVCSVTPSSYGGANHFLTITDDYSRFRKVYCIQTKDQVPDCL